MDNHDLFLKHLDESKQAVWIVARWLNELGYSVKIYATKKADKHENWKKYADKGDIEISDGDIEISHRIEVKRRGLKFINKKDWPHRDFIVCAKHAWDRAEPKPFAFIVLSNDYKYAGIVKSDSRKKWYAKSIKDGRYDNVTQEFYLIALDNVDWIVLGEDYSFKTSAILTSVEKEQLSMDDVYKEKSLSHPLLEKNKNGNNIITVKDGLEFINKG